MYSVFLYCLFNAAVRISGSIVITEECRSYQLHTKSYASYFYQGEVHILLKLFWNISMDFEVTAQLLIRLFAFVRY
jgi:hypothetical protein